GPLIGGLFASYGSWRGAFFLITALGIVLGLAAVLTLPADAAAGDNETSELPMLRVALICTGIALLSSAAVLGRPAAKAGLLACATGSFLLMLRIDRRAQRKLLPSDALSLRSATGAGLSMSFLLSLAYSPLAIYVPLILQQLHSVN